MPHYSAEQQGQLYCERLTAALGQQQYQHVYIFTLHHTNNRRIGRIRAALHGRAECLAGENAVTILCITQYCAENPHDNRWKALLVPEALHGKVVGLVFTTDKYRTKVPEVLEQHNRNCTLTWIREGAIAPFPIVIPQGPTGCDPGQVAELCHGLGIRTTVGLGGRIVLPNDVELLKVGTNISAAHAALLHALGMKTFTESFTVRQACFGGDLVDYRRFLQDQLQFQCQARWFEVHAGSVLHQMTDGEVMEAIARSDCDLELIDCGHITIGQWDGPNDDAARRVALIRKCAARRCPQHMLGHIMNNHLDIFYRYKRTRGNASLFDASMWDNDKLTFFGLLCRSDPWCHFARRCGPGVHCLKIDASHAVLSEEMAAGLSCDLYASGFRYLERLELVSAFKGGSTTRVIQAMLRSVSECPGIQSIKFTCKFDRNGSDADVAQAEYRCLAQAVVHTRTLSTLEVFCQYDCNGCDILEAALHSVSLKDVRLEGLSLRNARDGTPRQFQGLGNNNTLKSVHIVGGQIGDEGLALLSYFHGIETMRLVRVNVDPGTAERVTQLFSCLHALQELHALTENPRFYINVDWVEHALRAAPSLRSVTLDLSGSTFQQHSQQHSHRWLRESMVESSAALTIRFWRNDDIDVVCAGLEDATSLTDLTLSLDFSTMSSIPAILESVQRNASLVRFALVCDCDTYRSSATVDSLRAFFRNLRRNGRLKILSLRRHDNYFFYVDSSISSEIEKMLLDCNTTLQQIEGLRYESVDYQHRISRLLLLNRYGEDFVANATSVPMEHWGDVLMRIVKEECNFFVTELVRRAVEGHEF